MECYLTTENAIVSIYLLMKISLYTFSNVKKIEIIRSEIVRFFNINMYVNTEKALQ